MMQSDSHLERKPKELTRDVEEDNFRSSTFAHDMNFLQESLQSFGGVQKSFLGKSANLSILPDFNLDLYAVFAPSHPPHHHSSSSTRSLESTTGQPMCVCSLDRP